jgi:hypothetical protein
MPWWPLRSTDAGRLSTAARYASVLILACLSVAAPSAQDVASDAARRKTLDQILDVYVRDGYVYYRALRLERQKLDGYVTALSNVQVDRLSRDEQLVFWLNAYNALVLRTVIDHYPIQARSNVYPPRSIRQIPGAFDKLTYRVGGRPLTLDQIEQTILPQYHDPRVYLALGRGSVGGGRLRSEAFVPAELEKQLSEVASECASRSQCVQVDRGGGKLVASPIFSWREKEFVAAYADRAPAAFGTRSPVERAIIAFIGPRLLTIEREFLANNTFQLAFQPYDWTLNDLTGRGDR